MSELRRNPLTGEWVIIAPERGRRPHETGEKGSGPAEREQRPSPPARDPHCPFCPGNEGKLPAILAELPGGARRESPESPSPGGVPWQVRVVPNKFPALESGNGYCGELGRPLAGGPAAPDAREGGRHLLEAILPGRGRHEVIIESPRHDRDLASLAPEAAVLVLEAYRQRLLAARAQPGVRYVVAFRNHGSRAGTSLLHPHSQLVGVPVVPEEVARREREQRAYFAAARRCLLCELSARERSEGRRLVHSANGFDVLVPFAAGVPFELWVLPQRHCPDFAAASAEELQGLSASLVQVLSRMKTRLGDPDYNLVLHTFAAEPGDPALHWLLQIRPRIVTAAGFEVGSGMSINPSLPEADADELR